MRCQTSAVLSGHPKPRFFPFWEGVVSVLSIMVRHPLLR